MNAGLRGTFDATVVGKPAAKVNRSRVDVRAKHDNKLSKTEVNSVQDKAVPEEKMATKNMGVGYIEPLYFDDLPIMSIPSELAQGNYRCVSAVLKGIKSATPSKPNVPKSFKARREIREEEKMLRIDPVFGVTEESLEDEEVVFTLYRDPDIPLKVPLIPA